MYVIKKMRLHKFEPKPIVSNRALFVASGSKPATIESKDSSECYKEPSIAGASKTKVLGLANQIVVNDYKNHNGDNPAPIKNGQNDL